MSARVPAKRGGDWNGERPAWSREPFAVGNRAAGKSAFYVRALAASEREEVQTIADALRDLSPLDGEAQEALVQLVASQIWRQRQAVAYIDTVGIETVAGSSALLRDLSTLERAVLAGLKALGLTAQSCADLGLTWARTAALDVDLEKLSPAQLSQLEKLLDIAQSESNGAASETLEK
jgi:hypothetical protein